MSFEAKPDIYLEPCVMCLGTAIQIMWYRSVLIMPIDWQHRIQKDHWQTSHSPCVCPVLTCPVPMLREVSGNHWGLQQPWLLTAAARQLSTSRSLCGHQGREIQYLSGSSWLGRQPSAEVPHHCFLACWDRSTVWQKWMKQSRHWYSPAIQKTTREECEYTPEYRKANQPAHFHRSRLIKELDWVGSACVLLHVNSILPPQLKDYDYCGHLQNFQNEVYLFHLRLVQTGLSQYHTDWGVSPITIRASLFLSGKGAVVPVWLTCMHTFQFCLNTSQKEIWDRK